MQRKTNSLIHETSPYLLQHAHNPVNWYPWGEAALQKAREENKLILVSIGYAACHWCHVMEHQSFEDPDVAALMNEKYVAIKVDREERPDVDQIYMTAVQAQTGRGGWPLNVIALPDGRPIYGGTYFPREQWMAVLEQVHQFVQQNPVETEEQARVLTEAVNNSERIQDLSKQAEFTSNDLTKAFIPFTEYFDPLYGGHKGAPKFPLPIGNQFLLQFAHLQKSEEALKMIDTTLGNLASGGIYDQLGGGFARYATDEQWRIPHFEKMLYDNAQLVSLYACAYKQTQNPQYKEVVLQTLGFIERELTSEEGGFYSSLDADSEGKEGEYYIWTKQEIDTKLGNQAALFNSIYNIKPEGNWEHNKNILYLTKTNKQVAEESGVDVKELAEKIKKSRVVLLKEREKRIKPALDDKILTSWNALMLKAYTDAYQAFGNEVYLKNAERSAAFLKEKVFTNEFRLNRNFKHNKASINGFLDDYAFTIEALIALYQSTFKELYLQDALHLTEYAIAHFSDNETGMFFYTSDIDPAQIARKMELSDNVIPASNSQMAKNLFLLGHYYQREDFINRAERMLSNVKDKVLTGVTYYANWGILLGWIVSKPFEVVIIGDNFKEILTSMNKHYLPNALFSGGKKEGSLPLHKDKLIKGQTTIYVCRDKICQLPVLSVEEALQQLKTG